jgi:hypothetical protein
MFILFLCLTHLLGRTHKAPPSRVALSLATQGRQTLATTAPSPPLPSLHRRRHNPGGLLGWRRRGRGGGFPPQVLLPHRRKLGRSLAMGVILTGLVVDPWPRWSDRGRNRVDLAVHSSEECGRASVVALWWGTRPFVRRHG